MTSPQRTPDWLLERILLGELPPEELAAARARLESEPEGLARLAALEADTRATLERLPAERVTREVDARFRRGAERRATRPAWLTPAMGLVPVLAALALFMVVKPASRPSDGVEAPVAGWDTETTRSKGLKPKLEVHRQRGQADEALQDGARAAPGDVVQLAYVAAGRAHGVILSVDGRGAVTLHAPEHGARAAALSPSGTQRLPGAYELDDAPGFERFFLVTSDAPFEVEPVVEAARRLAASAGADTASLMLPEGLTQVSFTLQKKE
ncbi:ActD-like protein [Myxococcus sp. MISCRS1]|uniref:ActD-like protein n=1 Tax=Myxococcus TaxID=32 RepID=UPI001CC1634E|nr:MULTISPECIES: ActD-like protein [unclassified Myxococcus]MBZ4395253.1 ActD-like protein [Myxococcus sp. AS-1-15]MCY0999391.1 ActD-like protein [Myxococcus sp. MISCRS1]